MNSKYWQMIKNAAGAAEILIYEKIGQDFFGEGLGAKKFAEDLKALGDVFSITVRINSPGGNVFDGMAIYNLLATHKARKTVHIDGLAASIASIIAMAGDTIIMPGNATMMIHDPGGVVVGGAVDMRAMADILDKMKKNMVAVYRQKTGLSESRVAELLAAETWMTAEEAFDLGFCNEVTAPVKIAAHFDLSNFSKVPASMTGQATSNLNHQRKATIMKIYYDELRDIDPEAATVWAERTWKENAAARTEFSNKMNFLAYCRAYARGKIRIHGARPR